MAPVWPPKGKVTIGLFSSYLVVEAPGIESWGGGTEGDPTGANRGIGDEEIAPDATLGGGSVGDLDLARDVAALLTHVLGRARSTDKR